MSREIRACEPNICTEQLVKSLSRDVTKELLDLSGKSHHSFCKEKSGFNSLVEFWEETTHKWRKG